jgi:hypothetical protein
VVFKEVFFPLTRFEEGAFKMYPAILPRFFLEILAFNWIDSNRNYKNYQFSNTKWCYNDFGVLF